MNDIKKVSPTYEIRKAIYDIIVPYLFTYWYTPKSKNALEFRKVLTKTFFRKENILVIWFDFSKYYDSFRVQWYVIDKNKYDEIKNEEKSIVFTIIQWNFDFIYKDFLSNNIMEDKVYQDVAEQANKYIKKLINKLEWNLYYSYIIIKRILFFLWAIILLIWFIMYFIDLLSQ